MSGIWEKISMLRRQNGNYKYKEENASLQLLLINWLQIKQVFGNINICHRCS